MIVIINSQKTCKESLAALGKKITEKQVLEKTLLMNITICLGLNDNTYWINTNNKKVVFVMIMLEKEETTKQGEVVGQIILENLVVPSNHELKISIWPHQLASAMPILTNN